ncbi:putative reverse transcriptase domain-containing protein [Tanacetum coccineum]
MLLRHNLGLNWTKELPAEWLDLSRSKPGGEIKKIETEMWNLKVKGTDVVAYSRRFQQLALMCSRMFPEECKGIKSKKTMQEVIEFTTELMEDKTHAYAERQAERKRKNDDLSKNNQNQQNKRQNTSQAYTAGNSGRKSYVGSKPLCSKCNYNHEGPCPPRCNNCKRVGHLTQDCRSRPANANNNNNRNNNNNNRNNNNNNQQGNGCFECGAQGHFKSNCPRLRNNDRGNQAGNDRAPAKVYAVGNAGANPDNIVAGTFLLNNRYAYILFDTGADKSFVSTAFSTLLDIIPNTLLPLDILDVKHRREIKLGPNKSYIRAQGKGWTPQKGRLFTTRVLTPTKTEEEQLLIEGGGKERKAREEEKEKEDDGEPLCCCDMVISCSNDHLQTQERLEGGEKGVVEINWVRKQTTDEELIMLHGIPVNNEVYHVVLIVFRFITCFQAKYDELQSELDPEARKEAKRGQKEAALRALGYNFLSDVRQATPAWTNSNRVNKANQFTPRPVQLSNFKPKFSTASRAIKTGRVNVNTGKQNVSSGSLNVSSGTHIKSDLHGGFSTSLAERLLQRDSMLKANIFYTNIQEMNTVQMKLSLLVLIMKKWSFSDADDNEHASENTGIMIKTVKAIFEKAWNKKEELGVVVRNKARMVAQVIDKKEGIDSDEFLHCSKN